ncbi:glycosyltransferase family 22 protein [Lophiostoma macrostomum CBS 122681]|uniref:Mannosyltransferase n=1 Tax=Lophiostoma macrostomum CBS 122681 TaxID=1314788 RepID=A0A6A6TSM4_9PLEO|nr:glycosyltransferase family 22 protein [Lophiostoma macrostomum CBS 122681]
MPPASDSARATLPSRTGAPSQVQPVHGDRDSTLAVLLLLLAFRIVNALTLHTFFQPDEYFQSLEPAWQLAFGQTSNAWITWEWRSQLRSSLHPELFAGVYLAAAKLAAFGGLTLPTQAKLYIAAPKVAQAVAAALLDCYTWKLAGKAYGRKSRTALTTLAVSVCSPWQLFCSTRTLSNCLETTLTAIAVYHWPWHWPGRHGERQDLHHEQTASQDILGSVPQLRLSLLLAAFGCILRPTNALIWLAISIPTLWQASTRQRYVLVRESLFCGFSVLACSILSDRVYYQAWTLPPVRFLYFNVAQSLAVFYGRNRPDYYLTEGLPLLLTTALPFALVGSWQALRAHTLSSSSTAHNAQEQIPKKAILARLAWTCIFVTLFLSLIAHKEVRFLYPILPFLHILAARPLSSFFLASPSTNHHATPLLHPSHTRRALLVTLLSLNLLIAGYASQVHQRGVIDVLAYLRHKHEARIAVNDMDVRKITTTVGFLMPCHSTPWRSHLVHKEIDAWALTCEPPLNIPFEDRASYLDEADEFYINPGPTKWLEANMQDVSTVSSQGSRSARHFAKMEAPKGGEGVRAKREWPQYLVFFAQLESELGDVLKGSMYRECWRGFNSHVHDDRRRVGDVVVWCLD